jgi:hypothetical protein
MSTPNVGYGFVPCSHDDPKRSHWFARDGVWVPAVKNGSENLQYRKPAKIPDGWELVPELELDLIPEDGEWQFITNRGARGELANTSRATARSWINTLDVAAFIRRKPVQPTVEPSKPAVDWSKPIQTRDGRKAEFLRELAGRDDPFAAAVMDKDGREAVLFYFADGRLLSLDESPSDIINTPERIKREVWLTLYRSGDISTDETEEAAKANRDKDRVACVRVQIDCAIGEGL